MKHRLIIPFLLICSQLSGDLFDPDLYNSNSGLQWVSSIETINNYPFEGNERILDVGSGDGKITAFLSQKALAGIVLGLDYSEDMVDFASFNYQSPNLFFLTGSALDLPFVNQFDLITSFFCFNWIDDQNTALTNVYNALQPGGTFLMLVPENNPIGLFSLVLQLVAYPKWQSYFTGLNFELPYHTAEEYSDFLQASEFDSFTISKVPKESFFASRQVLVDWMMPITPAVQVLPEERREEFLNDLIDLYATFYPLDEAGGIYLYWTKLEVQAQK